MRRRSNHCWGILIFLSFAVYSQEDKKIYTEKEFQEKLKTEVIQKLDQIKKKSITDITKELLDREYQLSIREKEIEQKAEQQKIHEGELAKRIIEFQGDQNKVLGCIDQNLNERRSRVNKMVEVISNMKPEKAAQVLSVQDSEISVDLMSKIDPQKASKIFNLMEKEVSARLQKQYLDMKQ